MIDLDTLIAFFIKKYQVPCNGYLKSFVVGSSFPIFVSFFVFLYFAPENKKNYTPNNYHVYSIIAPLWFGFVNMMSLYLTNRYDIENRYLITGIVSSMVTFLFVYMRDVYNFDRSDWIMYVIMIILMYTLLFNIVVPYLETNI